MEQQSLGGHAASILGVCERMAISLAKGAATLLGWTELRRLELELELASEQLEQVRAAVKNAVCAAKRRDEQRRMGGQ